MKRSALLLLVVGAAVSAFADFEVYFLRHGETPWNRARILQGSTSYVGLTARGERMAVETAEGMRRAGVAFDRVYASPYLRAKRTAEIVAGALGNAVETDARLREMCFGRYEGLRYAPVYPDANLAHLYDGSGAYVPQGPGAESLAQVGARVREFLEQELAPQDGKVKRVLCVAHSLVLKAMVTEMFGDNLPASAKVALQRNCSAHVLRFANGKYALAEVGKVFYDPARFEAVPMPRTVAHRGAGDLDRPEASLPAYSNAVATASDIVKLDLQRTKDGVIVMGHDPTLRRNMGWNAKIADLTYAEICEKGRFLERGKPGSERIVRLDQVLPVVRSVPEFWIDFKFFTPDFAEQALAEFRRAKIDESRLIVATFTEPALAYLRKAHPNIRRVGHFNVTKDAKTGLWRRHDGKTFAMREEAVRSALEYRDKYGLFGVNMPVLQGQTTCEDVAYLRQNGLWVSLWFVQDVKTAAAYRTAGADAFVTDRVSVVREAFMQGDR